MYRAVIQNDGDWWIGWIEEVPGVNGQGKTREELLDNLRSALKVKRRALIAHLNRHGCTLLREGAKHPGG